VGQVAVVQPVVILALKQEQLHLLAQILSMVLLGGQTQKLLTLEVVVVVLAVLASRQHQQVRATVAMG
jgi:hypothetical protein